MLLNILLVILVIDCIALTGVILLQRSEGGALGMGGGPSGMFTARGAGDLLTRTTAILTVGFFVLSLVITLLAGHNRANSSVTAGQKDLSIGLDQLAKGAQSDSAPASSGAPAAPPLPGAAPPLPVAPAPQSQAPTQAPRPTASRPAPAPQLAIPSLPQPQQRQALPRPDLNAPPPAPASPTPNQ